MLEGKEELLYEGQRQGKKRHLNQTDGRGSKGRILGSETDNRRPWEQNCKGMNLQT